ncbi:MAG: dioxygenase [Desulfobulbaceae bacterium]|nr:MAG: dioxygenase [Desulfobulbaceae bacterium]
MSMPTLFISHGSPDLILQNNSDVRFLQELARSLPRPEAIICVSAHWDSRKPAISGPDRPQTIHDFYGFQAELYDLRYSCPGAPDLAREISEILSEADFENTVSPQRGLDHGAWAPLMLMYPDAEIPVIQLSIQTGSDTRHHYRIGQALAPLRDKGVLIIGSGGATHNLREFGRYAMDAPPVAYAQAFDDWLAVSIEKGASEDILDYRTLAPEARRNHPSEDHFLPIFAPLGAAGKGAKGSRIHRNITYGILSMAAFAWGL